MIKTIRTSEWIDFIVIPHAIYIFLFLLSNERCIFRGLNLLLNRIAREKLIMVIIIRRNALKSNRKLTIELIDERG